MKERIIIFLIFIIVIVIQGCSPRKDDSRAHTEVITLNGLEWNVEIQSGSIVGNNECILLYPNKTPSKQNSDVCYKFYTNEIFYTIDSSGKINIYAPYSSIKEPIRKDSNIIIHKLYDYDTISMYRNNPSRMGLTRITTSCSKQ